MEEGPPVPTAESSVTNGRGDYRKLGYQAYKNKILQLYSLNLARELSLEEQLIFEVGEKSASYVVKKCSYDVRPLKSGYFLIKKTLLAGFLVSFLLDTGLEASHCFILKVTMGKLKRHSDQLHRIWLLHWRRWERKGANVRGDGEGGRKASAQIGSQAHRQPRQSIFLISRVFSCQFFVCVSD